MTGRESFKDSDKGNPENPGVMFRGGPSLTGGYVQRGIAQPLNSGSEMPVTPGRRAKRLPAWGCFDRSPVGRIDVT
jgi:hypothetical protein